VSHFRDIDGLVKNAIPREELAGARRRIIYHMGIPDFEKASNGPRLVVLDNHLNDAYSRDVCIIFTKGSFHRNVSVILITQNVFHQGCFSSDNSLNDKYLAVFKNVRAKNQFSYIARQMYPEESNWLYESYLDATRRLRSYLLLDLGQDTYDLLRLRTHIFPSKATVVYAAVSYEKDTVELSPLTSPRRPDCEKASSRIRTRIWCSA
jgi:hypothetical protein